MCADGRVLQLLVPSTMKRRPSTVMLPYPTLPICHAIQTRSIADIGNATAKWSTRLSLNAVVGAAEDGRNASTPDLGTIPAGAHN